MEVLQCGHRQEAGWLHHCSCAFINRWEIAQLRPLASHTVARDTLTNIMLLFPCAPMYLLVFFLSPYRSAEAGPVILFCLLSSQQSEAFTCGWGCRALAVQAIQIATITGYCTRSGATLGLVQACNLLPRFKVFIRLRLVSLTVLINLEWSRQAFSLFSVPVAVSAETCPEVLAVGFFQACIIKVITRNTMDVPASFPVFNFESHV